MLENNEYLDDSEDEDQQETEELCWRCNGSGEGSASMTRCYCCRGSGVLPTNAGVGIEFLEDHLEVT